MKDQASLYFRAAVSPGIEGGLAAIVHLFHLAPSRLVGLSLRVGLGLSFLGDCSPPFRSISFSFIHSLNCSFLKIRLYIKPSSRLGSVLWQGAEF